MNASIDLVAEKFHSFRHSVKPAANKKKRFTYPKNLKKALINCYRSDPDLSKNQIAKKTGISIGCVDKWLKGVDKKHEMLNPPEIERENFVKLNLEEKVQEPQDSIELQILRIRGNMQELAPLLVNLLN